MKPPRDSSRRRSRQTLPVAPRCPSSTSTRLSSPKSRTATRFTPFFSASLLRSMISTGANRSEPARAGEHPCVQAAFPQLALVLSRHLLVRGHQHDVVEPPAGPGQVVPVLQDVGVHEERLAGAGRALEGEGTQIVRCVVGEARSRPVAELRLVQAGAKRLGVVEVAVEVVLGEQQGEILVRLPGPAVLPGHAQPPAERPDVGVVFREPVEGDPRGGASGRAPGSIRSPPPAAPISPGARPTCASISPMSS